MITGVIRAGKSKLMDAYHDYLAKVSDNNIIHIELNLKEFSNLTDAKNLYKYFTSKYDDSKTNYLLIDEVQMCEGFEKVSNNLHEEEKYDIILLHQMPSY